LGSAPNIEMSAMSWREAMIGHALVWGNGYSEIQRNGAGRPIGLWPLPPDCVTPRRDPDSNELYYDVSVTGRAPVDIPARNIFHLHGLGFDGTMGYSVVQIARQSIGLGLATERFGSAFFGNGAHGSGVLTHPGALSDTAKSNIRDSLRSDQAGPDGAFFPYILEEGMKWERIGIPPEDAQFLETRKLQVVEICRWFGVKPHMIADLERATYDNIEHQGIEAVVYTFMPWGVRLEQEANRKLLAPELSRTHFTKLKFDALLRGDVKSRFEAYKIGREWGWMSADDIRALEDMNPLPNGMGAIYLVPLNYTTVDGLLQDIDNKQKAAEKMLEQDEESQSSEQPGKEPAPKPAPDEGEAEQARKRAEHVRAAHARFFVDALRRSAAKEVKAVRRAATKYRNDGAAFWAWFDGFLSEHRTEVYDMILQPLCAMAELIQGEASESTMGRLRLIADAFTTEHLAEFQGVVTPAFGDGTLDSVMETWGTQSLAKRSHDASERAMELILLMKRGRDGENPN
jgi:HK97 family phage portal protein